MRMAFNIIIRNDMTHVAWNCSTTSDSCFSQSCVWNDVWFWPYTVYRDNTEHQIMQLLHIHGLWCYTLLSWLAHGHAIMQELFSALSLCETVCVSSSDWIIPQQIEVRTFFFFWLNEKKKIIFSPWEDNENVHF